MATMRLILFRLLKANFGRRFFSTTQSTRVPEETIKSGRRTVDVKDVEHLSNMSNEWWDVNGAVRCLHSFNPIRIQFMRDVFADKHPTFDKMKILEVGCGGGILAEALARTSEDVTAIDVSKELIETAVEHAALDSSLSGRLHYIHTSLEEHSESHANKYDAVVASEIIEHVADPALFVKLCVAATKPGGSLIITTMNRTIRSWFAYIIGTEYIFNTIPRGTHQWRKFISPNETKQLLEACGCETKLVRGMLVNPATAQWSWKSTTAYSFGLHAVKR